MKITSDDGHIIPNRYNKADGSSSACILAHGITADRSEGGIFDRQAVMLNQAGISTIQFDFLGHGESTIPSTQMTIQSETTDLQAVISALNDFDEIFLLSASFAAVATACLPEKYKSRIKKLCLWNPVLSLPRTFVEPELDWQVKNFGRSKLEAKLAEKKTLLIDDSFAVGLPFMREVLSLDVIDKYTEYSQPILILHGDHDTYVSYDVAEEFSKSAPNREFLAVPGSEHGFGRTEDEELVLTATTSFFAKAS